MVQLYGGTKHTADRALRTVLSPEQIRRGGTKHQTNKAFERYLGPDDGETEMVHRTLKELRRKPTEKKGEVIQWKP